MSTMETILEGIEALEWRQRIEQLTTDRAIEQLGRKEVRGMDKLTLAMSAREALRKGVNYLTLLAKEEVAPVPQDEVLNALGDAESALARTLGLIKEYEKES